MDLMILPKFMENRFKHLELTYSTLNNNSRIDFTPLIINYYTEPNKPYMPNKHNIFTRTRIVLNVFSIKYKVLTKKNT